MTRLTAFVRDFDRLSSSDDELLIGPDLALPEIPAPGPAAREILALFEGSSQDEFEIEILIGPGLLLH